MPLYKVTTHAMLIEAESASKAAMIAFRRIEDRSPCQFDVLGPDNEVENVALTSAQQEEAITIPFGEIAKQRTK
jgi:hypothetical protein